MPLDVIRSLDEPLLTRMVRSIPPRQLVTQLAKLDRKSWFRYFKGYRPEKVSRNQVIDFVNREIVEGENEAVGELLVVAWNASNWTLYEAMRRNVAKINPNVEEIERIEDDQARDIIADLAPAYEPEDIYICTVLNEVRFTPEFKETLKPGATPTEVAAVEQPSSGTSDVPEETVAAEDAQAEAPEDEAEAAEAEEARETPQVEAAPTE